MFQIRTPLWNESGIRCELVSFMKNVENGCYSHFIRLATSQAIVKVMKVFYNDDVVCL